MITLHVTGMTCDGCAKAVERVIKAQDPKATVTVNRAAERVEAKTSASADALIKAIEGAGYGAQAA